MELQREPSPSGDLARSAVVDGELVMAIMQSQSIGEVARASVDVVAPSFDLAQARELVDTIWAAPANTGAGSLELVVSDDLVRFAARRAGFSGPLRGPLVRDALLRAQLPDAPHDGTLDDDVPDLETLAADVDALVPSATVRRRGGFRRAYEVRATAGDGGTVNVRLPRRGDLMAEPIAAAIDTALAVKARFARAASGIGGLSFDHGGEALATGQIAGLAEGASGVVVLTPNFVCAELLAAERHARVEHGRSRRAARALDRPFAVLDGVTAHECWHYLDAEIRVSGAAYVEFNAALGDAFGVATLEHALRGRERDAAPEWRAAYERLVRDVSAYAGTNPREATAEMFSIWWLAEAPTSPVIARFGALVERFFPADQTQ